jgi:hypothetical protein
MRPEIDKNSKFQCRKFRHKWRGNELKYVNVNGNYLFRDA